MGISSSILDKNVPKLVVAAGASGALHLFDRNGSLTFEQPPDEAAGPTVNTMVIGPREDPFVAVGTVGGSVLLYNLSLPRGRVGSRTATTETKLTLATRVEPMLDSSGAPVPILTMDTYMRGRKAMLAVGDASGAVRLVFRNGTHRSTLAVGDGAVRAMERGGANNAWLAVGVDGTGVALYDMSKPNNAPLVCDGSEPGGAAGGAPVSALSWDVQLTQMLYAAGSDGVISVYNSKARTRMGGQGPHGNETRMVTHCKLVTTVEGHTPSSLTLAPVKGYLLSASGALLAAHNVSGLYARTRNDPNVYLGRALAGAPAALAGTRAGPFVVGSGAAGDYLIEARRGDDGFRAAQEWISRARRAPLREPRPNTPPPPPASSVEAARSGWLQHVRAVLRAGAFAAQCVAGGDATLVHCSDGWDRTSQLCALAQLILDPHCRTIEGFCALIEK